MDLPRIVVAHSDVVSWWQSVHGEEPRETKWLRWYRDTVTRGLAGATAVVAPSRWMLDAISANYTRPAQAAVVYNGRNPGLFNPHGTKEDLARLRRTLVGLRQAGHAAQPVRSEESRSASPVPTSIRTRFSAALVPHFRRAAACSSAARSPKASSRSSTAALPCTLPRRATSPSAWRPLEAAFSRCAIVANDIPTFHEIWGDTACYFRYNDADDLARTLERLHADRELRLTYANLAYHRARQRYTAERMVDDYMNLYASLVPAGAAVA